MKARIVERKLPNGKVKYVIQQKHFLFRWWWVDARTNSWSGPAGDSFDTLAEAQRNLCHFGNEFLSQV